VPVPHNLVHVVQLVTWQGTEGGGVGHSICAQGCDRAGQAGALRGCCVTVRCCTPPPQEALHVDQADTWQGMICAGGPGGGAGVGLGMHSCVLHVCDRAGQAGALMGLTVMERVWVPEPQGAEQVDHADTWHDTEGAGVGQS